MPNLRNGSKGGFEPGLTDCESGILPLSYRAPQCHVPIIIIIIIIIILFISYEHICKIATK